jgi:ribosomal protein S12 methylthiotransferase accessory factor
VDGPTEDLLFGLGAHLDPSTALRRAITEVNQFLPAVSRRAADGGTLYSWPDEAAVRFWTAETLTTQPQLAPASGLPIRSPAEFPPWPHTDLLDALGACLQIARRRGLDVMVLDQSHADIGLSVVRVVVPGLRHFWRRLGPGRLYDVPLRLGWIPSPIAEEDLNPTSIFF